MEHFRSINDVDTYVLANGREQLEVLYRRNAIRGEQSRAWAKAWLDRAEVRNTSYMSGMDDIRRMQEQATTERAEAVAHRAAQSAAAKAKLGRYSLYLVVLSALGAITAWSWFIDRA